VTGSFDFRPDIPAGMRVVEEPDDEPPGPVNPASILRSAVRSFLDVIRSEDAH
jgi:hypothetical protein